jgi:integrase
MSRPIHTLTPIQLSHWARIGDPIAKSDGAGLTFVVHGQGSASFVLRYRINGKRKEITLGKFPDTSLSAARERAREERDRVAHGIDVASEKQRSIRLKQKASDFNELANDYLAKKSSLRETTRKEITRYLNKDILPSLGRIPLTNLQDGDVLDMVEKIDKRSATVARRAFEIVSEICAHGVAKRLLTRNPCVDLKISAVVSPHQTRTRVQLTTEELSQVLTNLNSLGRENELALKIILATCVRKSELIKAEWANVDLDHGIWTVPPEAIKTGKSGKAFQIPLSPMVVEWFRELKERAKHSRWVLPARSAHGNNKDKPISRATLNAAIDRLPEGTAQRFSPHDIRSTARSYLSKLGFSVIVAEACLNHSPGGLIAVYDQHNFLDERREALKAWSDYIQSLETSSNVIPLKAKA